MASQHQIELQARINRIRQNTKETSPIYKSKDGREQLIDGEIRTTRTGVKKAIDQIEHATTLIIQHIKEERRRKMGLLDNYSSSAIDMGTLYETHMNYHILKDYFNKMDEFYQSEKVAKAWIQMTDYLGMKHIAEYYVLADTLEGAYPESALYRNTISYVYANFSQIREEYEAAKLLEEADGRIYTKGSR